MGYYIATPSAPNQTIYAVIQQISEDGRPSFVWDETNSQWSSFTEFPLFANDDRITLSEVGLSGVLEHAYEGETTANLGTYTGWMMIHIYNSTLGIYEWQLAYVAKGVASTPATEWSGADIVEGLANAREQTIRVRVRKYSNPNTPATGSVITCKKGYPAGLMSTTTNAATYTGVPGIYRVTLTASETDVEADLKDELFVEIVTSDGVGSVYLNFSQSALEADWADGGRLDEEVDAIREIASTSQINQALWEDAYFIPTLYNTQSAQIAGSVWNAASASYVVAGSTGERVERLDILEPGGAGEFTKTAGAKIDTFLDATVSARATPAQVGTQITAALVDLHLDHMFAATYDPTSKPGVADSLWNTLVEADGAVPRFTVNALENAGSGSGGDSAATIASAVWANATGVTLAANVTSILADTDAIDTTLKAGGTVYTVINNRASQTSVDALNDLSTADVDARLAAHFTASVSPAITNVRSDITALEAHGDGTWATATGFSTHNAAAVVTAMDASSTKLADIVADTAAIDTTTKAGGTLYTLVDSRAADTVEAKIDAIDTTTKAGGALYTLVNGRSSHSATDVVTAMDASSTKLAAIATDTDAIDITLKAGGEIHTDIQNISPGAPSSYSTDVVSKARTWVAHSEHATARNKVICSQGDDAHYAMDFTYILNPDTGVSAAGSVTRVEGDDDLTFGTPTVAKDNRHIHVNVTGQQAGKTYRVQFVATTTDGDTISAQGYLQVRG